MAFSERTTGDEISVAVGQSWGKLWDRAWFHFTGTPMLGLTTVSSQFDYSLGRPGKRVVPLLDCAHGGEEVDLWVEAGCNDLFGRYQDSGTLKEAHIAICNDEMRALSYDFSVLLELMTLLPNDSARHHRILAALTRAECVLSSLMEEKARRACSSAA